MHSLARVPRSLQLSRVEDLADMIRIVRSNVCYKRGLFRQLLIIGILYRLFPVAQNLIQLFNEIIPLSGIEIVECLIVISIEIRWFHTVEFFQRPLIPEPEVIGELSHRVLPLSWRPLRLIRG